MNRRELFKGIFSKDAMKTVAGLSGMSLAEILEGLGCDYAAREKPCQEAGLALGRRKRQRLFKGDGSFVKEGSEASTSDKS